MGTLARTGHMFARRELKRPRVFIPRPLVRSHAGITRLAFLRWQMDALAFCLHDVNCPEQRAANTRNE